MGRDHKDLNSLTREELIDLVFLLGEQLKGYTALSEWDLTPSEQVIFEALKEDCAVRVAALSIALELAGLGPSTYDTIRSFVSRLRKKLKASEAPWRINTSYIWGWSLEKIEV